MPKLGTKTSIPFFVSRDQCCHSSRREKMHSLFDQDSWEAFGACQRQREAEVLKLQN